MNRMERLAARVVAGRKDLRTTVVDNHGNVFVAWLDEGSKGRTLNLEEKTGKTAGRWSWYVSTLAERPMGDDLMLDLGRGWYVTGMRALMKEVEKEVGADVDADEGESLAEKDHGEAKRLRPEMEEAYDEVARVLEAARRRMSDFNYPGLEAAFLKGLRAASGPLSQGFEVGRAKAELAKYFARF